MKRCAGFEWAVADLPVRHDLNVDMKEITPSERLRFRSTDSPGQRRAAARIQNHRNGVPQRDYDLTRVNKKNWIF